MMVDVVKPDHKSLGENIVAFYVLLNECMVWRLCISIEYQILQLLGKYNWYEHCLQSNS